MEIVVGTLQFEQPALQHEKKRAVIVASLTDLPRASDCWREVDRRRLHNVINSPEAENQDSVLPTFRTVLRTVERSATEGESL